MSTLREALLTLEPTPPDEVKPKAPRLQHLSCSCTHLAGDTRWSVYASAELEGVGRSVLRTTAPTAREAWDEVLQFLERLVEGGL